MDERPATDGMNGKMRGKIHSITRGGEWVAIEVTELSGAVDRGGTPTGKEIKGTLSLKLKEVVANELKFGQELFITISTTSDGDR